MAKCVIYSGIYHSDGYFFLVDSRKLDFGLLITQGENNLAHCGFATTLLPNVLFIGVHYGSGGIFPHCKIRYLTIDYC